MFSDRTSISVVFPDLAVGDSVQIKYRLIEKEPMFPDQFSLALTFSEYGVSEDTRIVVRAPKEMQLKNEAHFFKPQEEREVDGKRVLEWRYSKLQPRKYVEEDDDGIWSQNEQPSVLVSTFQSYEAIAAAYGDRALPKAQPTARLRELAQTVVGKESQSREQARLLYEWVSRNITYGGNCIGVGAVVPRDVDVVLDNKMGDCKDHATLLQALLSASGIKSEQVLVNAGGQYELSATPVVSMVNHVMNFLPDFNLYVDATAKEVPFGLLPSDTYAKPVIHVGRTKAIAAVPSENHLRNEQRIKVSMKLAADGSATGNIRIFMKGLQAARWRAHIRDLSADSERDFVKRSLSAYGFKGKGNLEKGDTTGLSDQYEYAMTFEINNFLEGGTSGAFMLTPLVSTPLSVQMLSDIQTRPVSRRRSTCHGFHSYESYDVELAPGFSLVSVPPARQVRAQLVDYQAKYDKSKSRLIVTRELHDKTPETICSPEVLAAYSKQAKPIGENLKTSFLYRRKVP